MHSAIGKMPNKKKLWRGGGCSNRGYISLYNMQKRLNKAEMQTLALFASGRPLLAKAGIIARVAEIKFK
jgi:hypothetical protein